MLQHKYITKLNFIQKTQWNLVLYFFYFFTLLFCVRIGGVCAQGNRGVIINNQKFEDSSDIQYSQPPQLTTFKPPIFLSTTTTTQIPFVTMSKIATTRSNRVTMMNNQKVNDFNGIKLVKSNVMGTFRPPPTTKATTTTTTTPIITQGPIYTTRKIPLSTEFSAVTFQRQVSNQPYDHHALKWTSLATIDPPPKKQFEPQTMNTWFGIDSILRRNASDYHKIGEIINRVNQTGSLSHVNVLNSTSRINNSDNMMLMKRNVSYVRPYESSSDGKDSKELKVQFVLDCDLKNGADDDNSEHDGEKKIKRPKPQPKPKLKPTPMPTQAPKPIFFNPEFTEPTESSLNKHPFQYENNVHSVFNFQHIPIKRKETKPPAKFMYPLTDPTVHYYVPTRHTRKALSTSTTTTTTSRTTTKKPRIKNVYVDPPIVAEVSDVFENMYSYFEDAFTTKVKTGSKILSTTQTIPPKRRRKKLKNKLPRRRKDRRRNEQNRNRYKRPITKRSTITNAITPPSPQSYAPTLPPSYPPAYPPPYPPQLYSSVLASPFPQPAYSHVFPQSIPQVVPQVNPQVFVTTSAPNYRYTQDYSGQNAQKLTTNIQVTSQYVGKEPPTAPPPNDDSDSDDYSDDYGDSYSDDDNREGDDGDDDDDDDDDEDDFGISGAFDYDDSEESGEDLYDGPPPNKINDLKRPNTRRKQQHPSSEEDDSSDESDDEDSGFFSRMTNVGKYFQNTYDTITDYIPFGDEDDSREEDDADYEFREGKKKSSLLNNKFTLRPPTNDIQEKSKRWYDKFFFGSKNEETITAPTPTETTTESRFFGWFAGNKNEATEKVETIPITPAKPQGWFSHLFMGGTTETPSTPKPTPPPFYPPPEPVQSDPSSERPTLLPDTKKIFETIASHVAKLQLPKPSSNPNRKGELKRVNYDDYQIWRVLPSTHQHLEYLKEYKESDSSERVLWLKGPSMRGPNDILIPPDLNKEIQEMLEYESIPYEVVVWDLEKAIKYENPILSRRQKLELESVQGHPLTWYRYHTFEDIAIYMDYLQLTYPDLVDLIHIGRSFEGRPLVVAKISFEPTEAEILAQLHPKNRNRPTMKTKRKKKVFRPGVFIEAGVHGREWISPAVATWILKELVKHNSSEDSSAEKEILRSVDWYIMPVSNPDGYEFSLNYDRMWKKTRSKLPPNESMFMQAMHWIKRDPAIDRELSCHGTDPDRNYDIDWDKYSSSSACSETYAGPKSFSEPETKALAAFLDENKKTINLFVSLHSYGQFVRYPMTSNSTFESSQRMNDLRDMAEIAVNALRDLASTGRYTVDSTHEMSDLHSGSSVDYAMHVAGIKYAYTVELRDTGTQGFLLAPSYIDSTGLETFEMLKAMVNYI